jgi:hypothetical protein
MTGMLARIIAEYRVLWPEVHLVLLEQHTVLQRFECCRVASVLNQKFAELRCLGLSIVSAEAFDGSEDIVGGLGPFEWLGIGIVMTDEVDNVCAQSLDAAIDAAPDLLVSDERRSARPD